MSSDAQRKMIGDVAALIGRAGALFPEVEPSTVALWLLAMRAGRLTEAFTREVLAEQGIESTEFSILVVLISAGGLIATRGRISPCLGPCYCRQQS